MLNSFDIGCEVIALTAEKQKINVVTRGGQACIVKLTPAAQGGPGEQSGGGGGPGEEVRRGGDAGQCSDTYVQVKFNHYLK